MSPLYSINFRREAYQREIIRARRRVFALGAWVAYFGVIVILVGLYGLNCVSLSRRVRQIERQTSTLRGAQGSQVEWSVGSGELKEVERYVMNPRRWRDRLTRLAQLLPANVKVHSVAVNPNNLSGSSEQDRLVISGTLRGAGQDRMQDVMGLVARLRQDSLFASGYRSIRLASSRVLEDAGSAEFTIECR